MDRSKTLLFMLMLAICPIIGCGGDEDANRPPADEPTDAAKDQAEDATPGYTDTLIKARQQTEDVAQQAQDRRKAIDRIAGEQMHDYYEEVEEQLAAMKQRMLSMQERFGELTAKAREEMSQTIDTIQQQMADLEADLDEMKARAQPEWDRAQKKFDQAMIGLGEKLEILGVAMQQRFEADRVETEAEMSAEPEDN